MYIDEAKALIAKDKTMTVEELVVARKELYDYLNAIVDLACCKFTTQGVELGLDLCQGNILDGQIYLINLFQLYYLLNIKLIATKAPMDKDKYIIHAQFHGHDFVQIVNESLYDQLYKDISTMVTEHDVFNPYNH